MTTESLIDYIKKELNKNVSKELIISRLSGVGWHMDDIEEGFSMITSNESTSLPLVFNEVKNIYKTDPYHEQVESSSTVSSPVLFQEPKKIEPEKVEIKNNYETSK